MNGYGASAGVAGVWVIGLAFAVAGLGLWLGAPKRFHSGGSSELPAVLARHADTSRDDSIQVSSAVAVATAASQEERRLARRRDVQKTYTAALRVRADAQRAAVAEAGDASDSSLAWTEAYESRLAEVSSLRITVAQADSVTMWATFRADSLGSALVASERHAARADSVLAIAVNVQRCLVLKRIPCPGRLQVFGAALVTAALVFR